MATGVAAVAEVAVTEVATTEVAGTVSDAAGPGAA